MNALPILYESAVAKVEREDGERRLYTARLFSEKPNRRGDIVVVSGMDMEAFNANPVVLLQHGRDYSLPIGRAIGLRQGKTFVDATFEFDPNDEQAQKVEQKFSSGYMSAISVGFRIQDAEPVDEKDNSFFAPMRFTKTELLEFSVVTTPVDTTAMRKQAFEMFGRQEEEEIALADVFGDMNIAL